MAPGEQTYHEYTRTYPGASKLSNLPEHMNVEVYDGKLRLGFEGETEEIPLPEDAYTKIVQPTLEQDVLTVRIARKNPNSLAMIEKKTMDPDFPRPKNFEIDVKGKGKASVVTVAGKDKLGRNELTPAQVSLMRSPMSPKGVVPSEATALEATGLRVD